MMVTAAVTSDVAQQVDEQQLMRRVILRFMPIVTMIYLIAIIDRSNFGFAKLQIVQDLHMSEAVYGLGASLFGYLAARLLCTVFVRAESLPASCSLGAS
jgi:hypothetical protein